MITFLRYRTCYQAVCRVTNESADYTVDLKMRMFGAPRTQRMQPSNEGGREECAQHCRKNINSQMVVVVLPKEKFEIGKILSNLISHHISCVSRG